MNEWMNEWKRLLYIKYEDCYIALRSQENHLENQILLLLSCYIVSVIFIQGYEVTDSNVCVEFTFIHVKSAD
jgi:hypothetical protein